MNEEKLSMEDVVKHVESVQEEQANRVVKGKIIDIDEHNNNILVDIGYKSEGVIPLKELEGKDVNVGDEIEVFIVKRSSDYEHPPVLSYRRAQQEHQWEKLSKAHDEELVIDATIEKRVKGGLIVDIDGIKGFMPASLVGYPMVKNLDSVISKTVPCKIIEYDRDKRNVVVSWRKAIEEDVRRKREELYEQLYPGKIIKGTVTGIKSFGAFIDLGGVDGLLHISELSWGHVDKVEDMLEPGQEIEVKVKSFNPNSNKIALSLKETKPHPWENVEEKYTPGNIMSGKVTGVTNYGAFVEFEPGVEGLVRTEELSWTDDVKHAGDALKEGDEVNVKILEVDEENQKIALSVKQTKPNPWVEVEEKYKEGDEIEGKVTHLTDFGAFVLIPEGVEGLIHISDMSWSKEVKHPSEIVEIEDKVKVKILNIDARKQKISLGIKQLEKNPYKDFKRGDTVKAKTKNIQRSGAHLDMPNGVEAYLHISNFSKERIDDLRDHLKENEEIECKVTKCIPEKKYIEVSIKDLQEDISEEGHKERSKSTSGGSTLYDLIGDKLDGLTEENKE